MSRSTRAAALAAAVLLAAGCAGQRPTVTDTTLTPPQPCTSAGEPGPVCVPITDVAIPADQNDLLDCSAWTRGFRDDLAGGQLISGFLPGLGFTAADLRRLHTGLDRYCAAYPVEQLRLAAGNVVGCLWPDRLPPALRGVDCTPVTGRR